MLAHVHSFHIYVHIDIYICKYMQTSDNTLMFRYCKQIIPIIIWLTTWVNIRAKSYQVNSEIPKGRLVCIVGK